MKILPLLGLCLLTRTLCAAELAANASVFITDALDIAEISAIDFGQISNRNGRCEMTASGALSASDGQNCSGSSTPGVFVVSGSSGQVVTLSVVATASIGGVTFLPTIEGSINKTLLAGEVSVTVVGALDIHNATLGSKAIPFTLTANYQ